MKFKKILLVAIAAMGLASCDFFGDPKDEEEVDPNLYTLELKVNMTGADFQNIGLEYEPMDEEEMDFMAQEYGDKGITKENLLKCGTKDQDGKYLFMSQDGFILKAPMVAGYEMIGWYDGNNKIDGSVDYTYDGKTDYKVNMPAKNTVLEARYTPITYKFRMSSEVDNEVISNGMKEWNITMGDYNLVPPTIEGKAFKNWKFNGHYFSHAENIINVNQGETPDPRSYITIENFTKIDKNFLLQLGDVAFGYCADLEVDLVAVFETKKASITVAWPDDVSYIDLAVMVNHVDLLGDGNRWIAQAIVNQVEGASNPLTFTCNYGDDIEILVSNGNGQYSFDGYFVNGGQAAVCKNTTYSFKANADANIQLKFSEIIEE